MKRLTAGLVLAFCAALAHAATLVPIQLLNPAGSTAGQVIVSAGASTAPGWGNIPIANVTGGAPLASPAFTGAPTITNTATSGTTLTITNTASAGGAVVQLTGNGGANPNKYIRVASGLFQIINSSNSAGIFQLDDSGNLSSIANLALSGSVTPSQTAGIIGTTTNNNANAGSVGEFQQQVTTGTSLTNSTAANCSSVSLTAGDWDVRGTIQFIPTAALTLIWGSINTTSATQNGITNGGSFLLNTAMTSAQQQISNTRTVRLSLASTTTVYLVGTAAFASGTTTCTGVIEARRVR